MFQFSAVLLCCALTAAPADSRLYPRQVASVGVLPSHPRLGASQNTVTLLGYTATIPNGWTPRTPSSSRRLAEFVAGTPNPGAGLGAEVVVYFFGPGQGGSVDANLARWKSQFSNPDGGAVSERVTHDKAGSFPLTIAEYRGTYARGIGMGSAPEQARTNHVLVAVVAETPKGTLFFQLFGPAAAVEAQRAAYVAFVQGLK